MFGIRWRVGAFCAVLSAAAVCFSLQPAGIVTAEDKTDKSAVSGETASADQDASSGKTPASKKTKKSDANSKKKSSKKTPAKKTPARSSQQPATGGQGTSQSTGGSVGGGIPVGGGGNAGTGAGANSTGGLPSNDGGGNGGAGAGAQAAGAQNNNGPDPKEVQRVMAAQEKHTEGLMKQEGVVGTATGMTKDGKVFIKVYTSGAGKPVIPKKLDGVEVKAVYSGLIRPLNGASGLAKYDPHARAARPVAIGVSSAPSVPGCAISNNCYSGTLGCRLKAKDGSGVYALSNNHVFANENSYSVGHTVMQPSPGELSVFCACLDEDEIGRLANFKPIDTNGINHIDAAIIKTTVDKVSNSTLPDGYGTPRTFVIKQAQLGMKVQKYGRTTGYTKGTVTAVNAITFVGYTIGPALFTRQIEITGDNGVIFADHGDSGSLIVTLDRFPIALLFAGDDITHVVIGNPIQAVLDFFNMEIDGDSSEDFIPPGKVGSTEPK